MRHRGALCRVMNRAAAAPDNAESVIYGIGRAWTMLVSKSSELLRIS